MCYSKITSRREYEAFAKYVILNVEHNKHDELQLKFFKDGLRNQIFDMASIETGFVSEKAIATGLPKSKLTEEHIYPRNQSAKKLIQMAIDNCTIEEMISQIKKFCEVHITTKEENTALVQYQKEPDYYWENGYKAVGIKLVEYTFPVQNRYVYNVDGIVYNTLKEIASKFGIAEETARKRCQSKTEKFKGWISSERVN